MGKIAIAQSPMYGIIADIVKNNKNLTMDLQNAIAKFIEIEATPTYSSTIDIDPASTLAASRLWQQTGEPQTQEKQ